MSGTFCRHVAGEDRLAMAANGGTKVLLMGAGLWSLCGVARLGQDNTNRPSTNTLHHNDRKQRTAPKKQTKKPHLFRTFFGWLSNHRAIGATRISRVTRYRFWLCDSAESFKKSSDSARNLTASTPVSLELQILEVRSLRLDPRGG